VAPGEGKITSMLPAEKVAPGTGKLTSVLPNENWHLMQVK
jgi:hypothetical protein